MLLTSFDPFLQEFDRVARRAFGPATVGGPAMRMDGIRRKDDVLLRFDLPGIDAKSIEVTVDRGVLTVSAKRAEEYAEDEKAFIRERRMGSFTRRVYLSDTVDADKIEAGYADGVLTVRVPLTEKAQPRKVEVAVAEKEISA
ncbi:MAG TPA: Hsp20/alpha crystallin family protein [Streptosporangiaceae bacterium]|jgi:HSP20 family protein